MHIYISKIAKFESNIFFVKVAVNYVGLNLDFA